MYQKNVDFHGRMSIIGENDVQNSPEICMHFLLQQCSQPEYADVAYFATLQTVAPVKATREMENRFLSEYFRNHVPMLHIKTFSARYF